MADDQEKTEEPTPKKIEDARKEGNVPKSQDTSGVVALFVAILAFLLLFPYMSMHVINLFKYYFSLIGSPIDKLFLIDVAIVTIKEFLLIVMPISIAVAIAGIIAALAQFGFLFTTKAIVPDIKKIDPIKGIKNLISLKKLIESIKITFKSFTTLGVGFVFFFFFITVTRITELIGISLLLITFTAHLGFSNPIYSFFVLPLLKTCILIDWPTSTGGDMGFAV